MGIKFGFSIPLKCITDYARKVTEVPPLPEYITKRGPYIHDAVKIMVVYEFDKVKFAEGWGIISKHLEAFRSIPGFAPSAPIPQTGEGLKGYRSKLENQDMPKLFPQNS